MEKESPSERTQKEWPVRHGEARECGIKEALKLFQGGNGWVCQTLQSRDVSRGQRTHTCLAKVQITSDFDDNLPGGVAHANA